MTRINAGVHARFLTDEHLLAEHREIKRLPAIFKKRLEAKSNFSDIPGKLVLGSGHVLFFLDKGDYTCGRYEELLSECIKRKFTVTDYFDNWKIYNGTKYWNNEGYSPSESDKELLIARISDRILNSKKKHWHYYGKQITREEAIKILNT